MARHLYPCFTIAPILLAIAACVPPCNLKAQDDIVANDPPPKTLRIATWNVEWLFDNYQGDNTSDLAKQQSAPSKEQWDWKVDALANSIANLKPSIIALQEIENRKVLEDIIQVLKQKHNLTYRVAFIEGFDKATEQDVGILFRDGLVEFSRLEQSGPMFRSKQYYNLSKHICARFRWGEGDNVEELYLIALHLRARPEESETRIKQSKLIRHWLKDLARITPNLIILGDLNTEEKAGSVAENSDLGILLGGASTKDDDNLTDLLEKAPNDQRKTHLLLDAQFDRILASPSLMTNDNGRNDLVFRSIEVRPDLVIRGQGIDTREQHWENYWNVATEERDLSDHYPVLAEFEFLP
jgi:endonuclease/exonuclease/phosphatase family metal-dependent hydrolase